MLDANKFVSRKEMRQHVVVMRDSKFRLMIRTSVKRVSVVLFLSYHSGQNKKTNAFSGK